MIGLAIANRVVNQGVPGWPKNALVDFLLVESVGIIETNATELYKYV